MMFPSVVIFVFGTAIGSFLNVCIYRIPRKESIIFPASRCPRCNTPIKIIDNIPIISYFFLRGKCRECGSAISLRYPIVEFLNGVLYLGVLWRFGISWHTLLYLAFVSAMIVITFIDLDFQIIPDRITIPGMIIGIIAALLILVDPYKRSEPIGAGNALLGFLSGGGLFYLIAVVSKGGMGGGDIKMMAMTGAFLGWKGALMTTFLGSLTGSIAGVFLMIFKGKGRKAKIPFGPFLAFGATASLLFGQELLGLYLSGGL